MDKKKMASRSTSAEEMISNGKHKLDLAYQLIKKDLKVVNSIIKEYAKITKKIDSVHFGENIQLDIGGQRFRTSLTTLKKYPDSLLASMFSGAIDLDKTEDGAFFIDRDGGHFKHVLNFLRTGDVAPKLIQECGHEVAMEAKFFGIKELADIIEGTGRKDLKKDVRSMEELKALDVDDEIEKVFASNSVKASELIEEAREYFKKGYSTVEEDLSAAKKEQEHLQGVKKKLENVHFSEDVKLNIGGDIFETSLSTLKKDPRSMLGSMFSEKIELCKREDGTYFIDRDGTHFRHVLNYLRMGHIPRDFFTDELLEEARFYSIQGLVDDIQHDGDLQPVQLKVGGKSYFAPSGVLKKSSMLGNMLSERSISLKIKDEPYIVNHPDQYFHLILEFLGTGSISRPCNWNSTSEATLHADAKFYQIETMTTYLLDIGFEDSDILEGKQSYKEQLSKWAKGILCCFHERGVLVYSAQRDGWTAADFHLHCDDGKGKLMVIESECGFIFGGFLPTPLNKDGFTPSTASFPFSLYSTEHTAPYLMSSNGNAGTFTSPDILVSFRYSNYDTLSVVNEPQKNLCKYTSHGFYHAPVRTNTFLAGKQQFLIKRLEVFGFE